MNQFEIEGKKIIITGGSRGLGFGMAKALHDAGAELVIIASNQKRLEECITKLNKSSVPVHAVTGNLADEESLRKAFDLAVNKLNGTVDVLINCAGVQYRCEAQSFPLEQWNNILNINLTATFLMSQLAGQLMIKQGHGKIINIASMTSFFGSELIPAYTASKGGVMQLTKALSNEWASKGVTVNAIAPGYMETELTSDMKEKKPAQYAEITSRIPAHRWGKPEDLSGIAIFLSSAASDYISGAIIPVDGGFLGK